MSERDRLARPNASTSIDHAAPGGDATSEWRLRIARQRRALERRAAQAGEADAESAQEKAQRGLAGAGEKLPYAEQIQRSFGDHDIGAVQAHVGGGAAEAGRALGAQAFATGEQVGFAQAPDLHTAAHEAAHVLQQRAGGGPAGGLGRVGDAWERQADEVADRVARGQSAKPLLDRMLGQSASRGGTAPRLTAPVQLLAGDVASARVGEQFKDYAAGQATVGAALEAKDQAKYGRSVRDPNQNNLLKVTFENELASLILKNNSVYMPTLQKVSLWCMEYMKEKAAQGKQSLQEQLKQLATNLGGLGTKDNPGADNPNKIFLGRLADQTEGLDLTKQVEAVLTKGGTISQIMFTHHQFMDQIWGGGKRDYFTMQNEELLALAQAAAQRVNQQLELGGAGGDALAPQAAVAPKSARLGADSVAGGTRVEQAGGAFGESAVMNETGDKMTGTRVETAEGGRAGRARFDPGKPGDQQGAQFGGKQRMSEELAGISAWGGQGEAGVTPDKLEQPAAIAAGGAPAAAYPGVDPSEVAQSKGDVLTHSRGVDRVTMDEEQQFIQQARLVLDMPLAGAISGTTTDLMELGQLCGLGKDDQHLYALATLGHLESAGAHSFHEIATAAANVGVPYIPGSYRSYLPERFLALPEVQALFKDERFKEVPGIGQPLDYKDAPEEAPLPGPAAAAAAGGGDGGTDPKEKEQADMGDDAPVSLVAVEQAAAALGGEPELAEPAQGVQREAARIDAGGGSSADEQAQVDPTRLKEPGLLSQLWDALKAVGTSLTKRAWNAIKARLFG